MKGIFPIWKMNTSVLAHEFIDSSFKTVITCIDSNFLDKKFIGRTFDEHFLSQLPSTVDPCGENGEFHSFVYNGPIFRQKISHTTGKVVLRENRFYYCDLLPLQNSKTAPCPIICCGKQKPTMSPLRKQGSRAKKLDSRFCGNDKYGYIRF